MARRVASALISAATLLFVIVSFFGTANQGSLVRYESSYRGTWPVFTVTGVTDAGERAGLRPGDVLDFRKLTPLERYRFDMWDSGPVSVLQNVGNGAALGFVAANQQFTIPYTRQGREVRIVRRTEAAPWNDRFAAILTDIFNGFCVIFGALLLIRGRDRASLLGGLFLLATSVSGLNYMYGYDGFFTIGSVAVASQILEPTIGLATSVLLYLFAESFLPVTTPPVVKWIGRTLYAPSLLFINIIGLYYAVRYLIIGDVDPLANIGQYFSGPAYFLGILTVLAVVWYASIERQQTQRISVRIIFWSLLAGFSGIFVNMIFIGMLSAEWPLDGLLGLTMMALPVGFAYVVFTKNLYDIDFFVSRAALYAILLGIVVAVIALTESFLDHVALGRFGNIVVSFAVPIVLGLSMRWIGGRVESALQSTLYRDKVAAHERLLALVEDFSEAHNPDMLAGQVIAEIHRTFKTHCAVYHHDGAAYVPYVAEGFERRPAPVPQDDPAFMRLRRSRSVVDLRSFETALPRHGLLFPLTVVGRVYGAIFVGARPHDQWYDPDDQSVLRSVASELASALLWLRDYVKAGIGREGLVSVPLAEPGAYSEVQ
jgi:hypothetical protein